MLKNKKKKKEDVEQVFEIINRQIKGDGRNKSIQDDCIAIGFYKDYVVTRNGYVVGGIKINGVNIDLLSDFEQKELLEDYSSYLNNTLVDKPQVKSATEPVNVNTYIRNLKKQIIKEINENNGEPTMRAQIIAAKIIFIEEKVMSDEMSTQSHYIMFKEKIQDNNLYELDQAVNRIYRKLLTNVRSLYDSFNQYDMEGNILYQHELYQMLHSHYDFKSYNLKVYS